MTAKAPIDKKLKVNALYTELSNLLVAYITSRVEPNNDAKNVSFGIKKGDQSLQTHYSYGVYRNLKLTHSRVMLINDTLYEINELFKKDDTPSCDELSEIILRSMTTNSRLSQQNGKNHFSYSQALDAGYNFFAAFFKRTLFQSQAHLALENCLDAINDFKALNEHQTDAKLQ